VNPVKLSIESTSKIVQLDNGLPARVWEGKTESGIAVHCFITRVAVAEGQEPGVYEEFERELRECRKASPVVEAIPLRLIL
jgi:hypothetical protein